MRIDRERLTSELYEELLPLAQKCWNESTLAKGETCAFYGERDFQIDPDFQKYRGLEDRLVIITLRDEGALKGYLIGFSYQAMHHKKIMGGIGDSMYLEPDYRSYTAVVAERFEQELGKLGVQIIGWPVTPDSPLHKVLIARGYVGDDIVMEKRLCVS